MADPNSILAQGIAAFGAGIGDLIFTRRRESQIKQLRSAMSILEAVAQDRDVTSEEASQYAIQASNIGIEVPDEITDLSAIRNAIVAKFPNINPADIGTMNQTIAKSAELDAAIAEVNSSLPVLAQFMNETEVRSIADLQAYDPIGARDTLRGVRDSYFKNLSQNYGQGIGEARAFGASNTKDVYDYKQATELGVDKELALFKHQLDMDLEGYKSSLSGNGTGTGGKLSDSKMVDLTIGFTKTLTAGLGEITTKRNEVTDDLNIALEKSMKDYSGDWDVLSEEAVPGFNLAQMFVTGQTELKRSQMIAQNATSMLEDGLNPKTGKPLTKEDDIEELKKLTVPMYSSAQEAFLDVATRTGKLTPTLDVQNMVGQGFERLDPQITPGASSEIHRPTLNFLNAVSGSQLNVESLDSKKKVFEGAKEESNQQLINMYQHVNSEDGRAALEAFFTVEGMTAGLGDIQKPSLMGNELGTQNFVDMLDTRTPPGFLEESMNFLSRKAGEIIPESVKKGAPKVVKKLKESAKVLAPPILAPAIAGREVIKSVVDEKNRPKQEATQKAIENLKKDIDSSKNKFSPLHTIQKIQEDLKKDKTKAMLTDEQVQEITEYILKHNGGLQ